MVARVVVALLVALISVEITWQACTSGCGNNGCSGCGNGVCETNILENCGNCPADCGLCPTCDNVCGNLRCETNETACNCPDDCGVCCLDGYCTEGETMENCFDDCSGTLTGTVFDQNTGAPLGNASVSCVIASSCPSKTVTTATVMTNSRGSFSYAGLRPGYWTCTASAGGYVSNSGSLEVAPGKYSTKTVQIPLWVQLGTISGRTFAGGSWLRGVNVTCTGPSRSYIRSSNFDGTFYFAGVAAGAYTCSGTIVGYTSDSVSTQVNNGQSSVVNLNFRVVSQSVMGPVIDRRTGLVVPGADVVCTVLGKNIVFPSTRTDAAGMYTVSGVTPFAEVLCRATKDGYYPGRNTGCVDYGKNTTIRINLDPAPGAINGTVTDSSTSLPLEAQVQCTSKGFSDVADTDGKGNYLHPVLDPSTYNCTASVAGYSPQTKSGIVFAGKTTKIDFALEPLPGRLFGFVYDVESLKPISNANVRCTGRVRAYGPTNSNNTGYYQFDPVVSTFYNCSAAAQTYDDGSNLGNTFVARGGFARVDIYLKLKRGSLTVTTRDMRDNSTLPGCSVVCTGQSGTFTATTDGNAFYRFTDLKPGRYDCTGSRSGYTSGSNFGIVVGGSEVSIDILLINPPASIIGRVYENAGSLPTLIGSRVSCTFTEQTQPSLGPSTITTATGYAFSNFLLVNYAVVTFTFSCTGSMNGYYPNTVSGQIARGQTVRIDIPLAQIPSNLTGTVTERGTGKTLSGASVVCTSTTALPTTTSATGSYAYIPIAVGNYSCVASKTGWFDDTGSVAVFAGQGYILNFALTPRPSSIVGRVYDADSNATVANSTVTCTFVASTAQPTLGPQFTLSGNYAFANFTLVDVAVLVFDFTCSGSATGYAPTGASTSSTIRRGERVTVNIPLRQQPSTLEGTVVDDSTSNPLSGASVVCTYVVNSVKSPASTNNTGGYLYTGLGSGRYDCVASKEGWSDASGSITIPPGTRNFLNFRLVAKPAEIFGRVYDSSTGSGLALASVTCVFFATTPGPVLPVLNSSPTGNYSHANIVFVNTNVFDFQFTCNASLTGYSNGGATGVVRRGGRANVDIPLRPLPASLTGVITDRSSGQVLRNATVQCSQVGGSNLATLDSNELGVYLHSLVSAGNYSCTASKAGWSPSSGTVSIQRGETGVLNLSLQALPAEIFGRVFDSRSLSGLVGAPVTCQFAAIDQPSLGPNATVTNGNYSFSGIILRSLSVSQFTFNCTSSFTGYGAATRSGTVSRGGRANVDIPLVQMPAALTGVVSDNRFKVPLPEASVYCSGPSGNTSTVRTNSTGGYYFGDVGAGTWTCYASKLGWSSNLNSGSVLAGQTGLINIALDPLPAVIFGQTRERITGTIISSANVNCFWINSSQAALSQTTTNSTGNYTYSEIYISDVAASSISFRCTGSKAGYGSGNGTGVIQRGSRTHVDLLLLLLGVEITVLDKITRAPIANATVSCTSGSGSVNGLTDAKGFIADYEVIPDSFTCTATKTKYSNDSVSFQLKEDSGILKFTLFLEQELDLVRFVVLGFNGPEDIFDIDDAHPFCTVRNTLTNATVYSQETNQSILFRGNMVTNGISFRSLVPARFVVTCTLVLYAGTPTTFNLGPNNVTNIYVIYLSPSPSQIQGYVRNSTSFLSDVTFQLTAIDTGSESRTNVSLPSGFYRIPDLDVGRFSLRVSRNGYFPIEIPVNVTRLGQLITRNFTLEGRTTGSLAGTVFKTNSTAQLPAAGATVTVFWKGNFNSTTANSNGEFLFPSLVPSNPESYNITASLPGYRSDSISFIVYLSDNKIGSPIRLTQKAGILNGTVYSQKAGNPTPAVIDNELIQICLFAVGKPVPSVASGTSTCAGNDGTATVTQGSKGAYSITNVPEGTYYVFAWSSQNLFAPTTVPNTVQIVEGTPKTQDIVMPDLRKRRRAN